MKLPWRPERETTLEDVVVVDPDGTPRLNLGDGMSIAMRDAEAYWLHVHGEGQ